MIAGAYVVAAVLLTVWLRTGRPSALSWGWLGLYVDLLALSALSLIAGQSSAQSWTSYVLLGGFFLLPVLAATQLHWGVCASVVIPTVVFYAVEAFATQDANAEPLASIVLRVLVLTGVGHRGDRPVPHPAVQGVGHRRVGGRPDRVAVAS